MKTIEKELKKFNFPQILVDLHRNRKTGTLTVFIPSGVTKIVYLDKGNAVFSSSTDEDDRLGETLIKLGKITFEQYDRSVELLLETGKRQGTILVELGYMTPKDLVLGVKSQVREIIYSLFLVEDAEYEFDEGPLTTREVITLQMSMGNLIYEGVKRINNIVRIKREMPAMNVVLKMNEDPVTLFQDIVLGQRDKAILSMIDGTKTVKEIIDGSSVASFEAIKTVYVLCITGFVVEQKNIIKAEEQISYGGETGGDRLLRCGGTTASRSCAGPMIQYPRQMTLPLPLQPDDLTRWIARLYQEPELLRMGHNQGAEDLNLGLGWVYYALARLLQPRRAVVIGSYRGFVPLCIGRACQDNLARGTVTFIDPSFVDDFWKDPARTSAWFAGFGLHNVEHHLATTQQFAESAAYRQLDEVGLLFIDGYHTAEQARFDYRTFENGASGSNAYA